MDALVYRPAHVHANLLGFVSMMIFGVAYHVMPRFTGCPLWSPKLAWLHLIVANLGLTLMVAGWLARPTTFVIGSALLATGAVTSTVGAWMFVVNIWRTITPASGPIAPKISILTRIQTIRPREAQNEGS